MTALTRKLEVLGGDDSTLLKVAFASADRVCVDQHFGSARAFLIFGVNSEQIRLLSVCEFEDLKHNESEDKLAVKLELLKDCIAVYCRACGSSAISQLLVRGVQPVKVSEQAKIRNLIDELQQELRQGPSAWLAKAVARNRLDASRFNEMELDSWRE
jgi:nitrogen fixation protein NifX